MLVLFGRHCKLSDSLCYRQTLPHQNNPYGDKKSVLWRRWSSRQAAGSQPWERSRASHTGQVQRTAGGRFHFKNETVVMGKGYILSPSSRLVNFWDRKKKAIVGEMSPSYSTCISVSRDFHDNPPTPTPCSTGLSMPVDDFRDQRRNPPWWRFQKLVSGRLA